MNYTTLLHHPYLRNFRQLLGHAAIGFGTAWVILFTFELWRPGAISWYLNLNLLLLLTVVAWVCGVQAEATPQRRYIGLAISAILVVGSAVVFVVAAPWVWWTLPLALLSVVVVTRIFHKF